MILQVFSNDFNTAQVDIAHPHFTAVIQVTDLRKINTHQFNSDTVSGKPVLAYNTNPVIDRSSKSRSVMLHSSMTIDHCKIRTELLGKYSQVVINCMKSSTMKKSFIADSSGF